MPKWKANIGAQYEADLGNAGTITPRVDVFYQDKTFAGFDSSVTPRLVEWLPKFTLVNARLTWRNQERDLSVALEVTNLTDEYYFYSVFDSRPNNGVKLVTPARPREWAVTVKKNF
jgi:iron complex outermembrane receptor protein